MRAHSIFLLNQDNTSELDTLKNGRYIKQIHISGYEGKILADIAADDIYLRHLPETYRSGRHIDAARFVMIISAFEWEFHRLYPNGIKKSDSRIAAENAVSEKIEQVIGATSGKQREIYKFLRNR